MQHWTKLHTGVRPRHSTSHAACCIAGPLTGEKHPLLMVIGGQLDNGEALDDVWLLDVDDVLWTKVGTSVLCPVVCSGVYNVLWTKVGNGYTVPCCVISCRCCIYVFAVIWTFHFLLLQLKLYMPITSRYGHSAVVFDLGRQLRVVVLFGGSAKDSRSYCLKHMSETTLLWLGKWMIFSFNCLLYCTCTVCCLSSCACDQTARQTEQNNASIPAPPLALPPHPHHQTNSISTALDFCHQPCI